MVPGVDAERAGYQIPVSHRPEFISHMLSFHNTCSSGLRMLFVAHGNASLRKAKFLSL